MLQFLEQFKVDQLILLAATVISFFVGTPSTPSSSWCVLGSALSLHQNISQQRHRPPAGPD
jgi:hypothetical protein